jgi:riboflavin kinase/FMN adenylyltransferase
METLNFSTTSPSSITSLAIGGFDGVHIAHQTLIDHLDEHGAVLVVETNYANLTPKKNRADYIDVPMIFFDLEEIKEISGKAFIEKLKEIFPSLKRIVVGYDFHFGKDRSSSAYDLKKFFDHEVVIVEEVLYHDISVHSKIIREHIKNGDIEFANRLLNHTYKIKGKQIEGQGLGKNEFVPTINITTNEFLLPKEGVYITQTTVEKRRYNSITFSGHRVTTDGSFAIETYILEDFDGVVEEVEIEFLKRVRDNQKFDTYRELKERIDQDVAIANEYFKTLTT